MEALEEKYKGKPRIAFHKLDDEGERPPGEHADPRERAPGHADDGEVPPALLTGDPGVVGLGGGN